MELVNLVIIIIMIAICIVWALRKRKEIETTTIDFNQSDNAFKSSENEKNLTADVDSLNYASKFFQDTVSGMMKKIHLISLICFAVVSVIVWLLLEEKFLDIGQGIFFFIGAYSQILIGFYIFNGNKLFDPKIIIFARISKWSSLDQIIGLNSFITLANQGLNLLTFIVTYYIATFLAIDVNGATIDDRAFEKFHRRFFSFGFGTVFAYFLIKSLSHVFCQGSAMVVEIMARQSSEGIEEDHPKNPARIINNISESFLKTFQTCLEFNALTNMGLCIYQDLFVTRSVYLIDRGFLNATAITAVGLGASLVGMLYFRSANKFKASDSADFMNKLGKMRTNGLVAFLITAAIVMIGTFCIVWVTFPDSVAVYNPFSKTINKRGITYFDGWVIFILAFLIVITLIVNSLLFTVPNTMSMKAMSESAKVCFSLNLLQSDFWSCFATVLPMLVFFIVLYINFKKASIFGICMEYLGIITFCQIIQFFQNFKHIYQFYLTLLMSSRPEFQNINEGFVDIINCCRFFGKFSNGVTLFVLKILAFVILVDAFNINIVSTIIVIDPYYILGIVFGCIVIYCLTSLDIRTVEVFTKYLLQRIKRQVLKKINDADTDPPIIDITSDMTHSTLINQILLYFLPVASLNSFRSCSQCSSLSPSSVTR